MKTTIQNKIRKALTGILLVGTGFLISSAYAQSPQAIKYQGVARDNVGNELAFQSLGLRLSIVVGNPGGASVYTETQNPTTNEFGLFNVEIGNGTMVTGNFSTIDWGADLHFLKVEMDETGGTAYQLMGTSQLLSVPYALYADSAGAAPGSAPQTLALSGNALSISGGNSVTLTDSVIDDDADPANELQTLSLSGSILSITGGNTVTLSATAPSDTSLYADSAGFSDTAEFAWEADTANFSYEADTANFAWDAAYSDTADYAWNASYSDTAAFALNAVWDQSGDTISYIQGNVGIGTTTPGAKLEVAGQIIITGGTPFAGEVLTTDNTGLATWEPPTGSAGPTGPTGLTGTNGAVGATGPTGAPGTNGTNGTNGATGATGAPGTNGTNGTNGATGPTGAPGTNGTNGTNGATGATGPTGPLVAGTSGQTLRHDGTNWVANSNLYNNGTAVGIGTVSPGGLLEVSAGNIGDALFILEADEDNNNENDNPLMEFRQDNGAVVGFIGLEGDAGTKSTGTLANAYMIGTETSLHDIQFITEDNVRLTIKNAGNIGIGTTSPLGKLDVQGGDLFLRNSIAAGNKIGIQFHTEQAFATTDMSGRLFFREVDAGTYGFSINYEGQTNLLGLGLAQNDVAFIRHSGSATGEIVMMMNRDNSDVKFPNGNVGIGTASPSTKLHINAKIIDDNSRVYDGDALMVVHQTPTSDIVLNDPQDVLYLGRQGSATNAFGAMATFKLSRYEDNGTNSRTRLDIDLTHGAFTDANVMTLLSNGNVGIGTTSPGVKLDVKSSSATTIQIQGGTTSNSAGILYSAGGTDYWTVGRGIGDGSSNYYIYDMTSSTHRVTVDTTGNVGIGTTAPNAQLSLGRWNSGGAGDITTGVQLRISGLHNSAANAGGGYKLLIEGYDNDGGVVYPIFVQDENSGVDFWLKNRPTIGGLSTAYFQGSVGIGETNPGHLLHIKSTIQYNTFQVETDFIGNTVLARYFSTGLGVGQNTGIAIGKRSAAREQFGLNYFHAGTNSNSNRLDFSWNVVGTVMSLTAGGNLGIGTTSPNSRLAVVGLLIYANNAAALVGGLVVGDFYRSGGDPDLVCVVH